EGINADAMASDEPRREVEEVPFRARRLENVISGNAKLLENHCRLIDEGDVDVALRILDDLRGLGRLDVAGAEGAARGRSAIHVSEDIRHLLRLAGDDLDDLVDRMHLVAGIDALRRVAEIKILPRRHAGRRLEDRAADVFGDTGINRAFDNDD